MCITICFGKRTVITNYTIRNVFFIFIIDQVFQIFMTAFSYFLFRWMLRFYFCFHFIIKTESSPNTFSFWLNAKLWGFQISRFIRLLSLLVRIREQRRRRNCNFHTLMLSHMLLGQLNFISNLFCSSNF
jgi:hypothetical protein